ncbi:MAG TPA: TRAP transporter large permease subunit, partial [Burkholderiaceae bacterium]|nr:TRAP transporter large permease subunit [Burkholderiaceae bacterium]
PPFGFALFYLRSVAPIDEYTDRVTKKRLAPVTTGQIYWGAVPFVVIQVIMVGLIIAFPNLVSGGLAKKADIDTTNIRIDAPKADYGNGSASVPAGGGAQPAAEDPMEAVRRALEQDKKK